jgi:YgiT-type zinc finger domain-containing protein
MDLRFYRENKMKCAICRNGITESGYTTVLLEKDEITLVFKNVPAKICGNCGEEYISSEINRAILSRARDESGRGITLEMLRFEALKDSSDSKILV